MDAEIARDAVDGALYDRFALTIFTYLGQQVSHEQDAEDLLLVVHWNGKQWSIVPSPNPGKARNELRGVTAISASDVWAVGEFSNSTQGQVPDKSLTMHWNGSRWSVVPSPGPNAIGNDLTGVTARSVNDVWAVGTPYNMLVEHWDGSHWSVVRSNSQYGPTLAAVALVPHSNTVVSVGVDLLLYFKDPDGASLATP